MGTYINWAGMQPTNKAQFILDHVDGAVALDKPSDVQDDHVPVCVVSNGPFEAAAIAYNDREIEEFTRPTDMRPKVWISIPKAWALAYDSTLAQYITV